MERIIQRRLGNHVMGFRAVEEGLKTACREPAGDTAPR
jgi:hypothetical protein